MQDVSEKSILIQKIIRILKSNSTDYTFLNKLELEDLNHINDDIQDALFNDQSEHWKKLAKVVKFFPNYMNAKISEQAIGAYITANVCYHIETKDLAGISKYLSIPFLAEVTEIIIPSKSSRIVNEMPISIMQKIIHYLLEHNQHFVVASFIEVVYRKRLLELVESIPKESDLIKCSEYIRNSEILKDIFLNFSSVRQMKIIEASIQLNKEAIIVRTLQYMSDDIKSEILNQFAHKHPKVAEAFIQKVNT